MNYQSIKGVLNPIIVKNCIDKPFPILNNEIVNCYIMQVSISFLILAWEAK